MTRDACCECEKQRERCRPSVRHADGSIDVCCPQCWKRLDYSAFLKAADVAGFVGGCTADY